MTRAAAAPRQGRPTDDSPLVTEGIGKIFGRVCAVDDGSLSIPAGQFVGVIGRSGAGKSTLLRMLNRLTDPTSGRILCDGIEVTALKGRGLRAWRQRCAMIFQQFNLVGRLDVLTNVLMGRLAHTRHGARCPSCGARRTEPWPWPPSISSASPALRRSVPRTC